ncbi:hypothetical protein B9Z55_010871 [Caenorhabditis nigoni]|uniref:Fungal lipase-type domain-containing protein n=2 Tax=Caenorhabditis nigoni TaxID=1611254 RepID=A0A2G5UHN1_9PELO|nr:hypothetical protein B9Z55_010871 [Caenorhabditis nigoni]
MYSIIKSFLIIVSIMVLILLLLGLLPNFFYFVHAQNCSTCVESGNIWCVESAECNDTFSSCQTQISLQLNCPTLPNPKYAYDDSFMRTQQLVLASASHCDNPQRCFDSQIPTIKVLSVRTVNCSANSEEVTCMGYTAYDVSRKIIILSFRGSKGPYQNQQMADGMASGGLLNYFGHSGKIFKLGYDYFQLLWNGGMQQDLRSLKYKYPGFELWINGHSLGGMLSWVASSYLVTSGLYKPEDIKVVAFGSPRLGDYDFSVWYTQTFPYSYHIIHRLDLIPRVPVIDPHTNTTVLFHPRTEVWYNNYMKIDDPYQICEEADGNYCSAAVTEGLTMTDHGYYFNVNMPAWGRDGCPQNISDYAQL